DLVRERGGEQEVLAPRGQHPENPANVADEAHVEHAIRFVQHENLDAGQVEGPALHVVEQAARRGDDDVDALAQLLDLRVHADAPEDHGRPERQVAAVRAYALADLRRELARRHQDQRPHAALRGVRYLQALQQRQREAGGLAGAGLRADENVAYFEDRRD